MFYFSWLNFISVGIGDISFQSAETGKYATPTGYLNFHFTPLVVSYELFPLWNQRQSDLTQQYTPVLFTKTPRELLPEKELLSGHYATYSEVAARDSIMNTLKIAGST